MKCKTEVMILMTEVYENTAQCKCWDSHIQL